MLMITQKSKILFSLPPILSHHSITSSHIPHHLFHLLIRALYQTSFSCIHNSGFPQTQVGAHIEDNGQTPL